MSRPAFTLLLLAACATSGVLGQAPAGAPAPLAEAAPPPVPGLPSKAELAGLLLSLANAQSLGASKIGLDLSVTCTSGKLNPSKRAPAVLQWPSARALVVTALCVKNGTSEDSSCEGAVTASQTLPAYALPPRWEPATFITPACSAGIALPFPGRVAALPFTPPGGDDGGIDLPLLPPTMLECDSLAALGSMGTGWLGLGRRGAGGCRVSGPLVDPAAAVEAALVKLGEVSSVLGLASPTLLFWSALNRPRRVGVPMGNPIFRGPTEDEVLTCSSVEAEVVSDGGQPSSALAAVIAALDDLCTTTTTADAHRPSAAPGAADAETAAAPAAAPPPQSRPPPPRPPLRRSFDSCGNLLDAGSVAFAGLSPAIRAAEAAQAGVAAAAGVGRRGRAW